MKNEEIMTSEYFCVGITVVIVNPDSYGAVGKILEINDLGIVFEITRSGSWGGVYNKGEVVFIPYSINLIMKLY